MNADLRLRRRARFEDVAAACAEVRSRVRRGNRMRACARALMFVAAVLGGFTLARALGTEGTARASMILLGLALLSIAALLRQIASTPSAIDDARLALIEHVLAAFDHEICDEDVVLNANLDASRPYEQWLHLIFRVRNDSAVHVSRNTMETAGSEQLTVGLVLPNGDLFGSRRPTVTVRPPDGLTVTEIDVQGQAVVFKLHGRPGRPLSGELVVRTIEACRHSVAGLRSFSQPVCHPPRAKAEAAVPEDVPGSTSAEQAINAVAGTMAGELTLDLAPAATGVSAGDLAWIPDAVVSTLWEWRAEDEILERRGIIKIDTTRERSRRLLEPAVAALLRPVRPVEAVLPRLRWTPDNACFPDDVDDRVRLTCERPGAWLAVHDGSIVACEDTPEDPLAEPRVVAPLPANFDPERQGALAHDPERGVLGLWMRSWALSGSRTFFWDPARSSWTEHRHRFRPEDEHAGVTFLFDHARQGFAHLGVTYSRLWTADESCVEQPAGLLQLALSPTGRIAVSDAATAITLAVDFAHGRVARCADGDWDLVATIEPSDDLETHPSQWSILPTLYRYDAARKQLLWQERGPRPVPLALDLAPAFTRAAATSTRPVG